jgi:hypothetical protein
LDLFCDALERETAEIEEEMKQREQNPLPQPVEKKNQVEQRIMQQSSPFVPRSAEFLPKPYEPVTTRKRSESDPSFLNMKATPMNQDVPEIKTDIIRKRKTSLTNGEMLTRLFDMNNSETVASFVAEQV